QIRSAKPEPSIPVCLPAHLHVQATPSGFPGHDFRGTPARRLPGEETASGAGKTVRTKFRLARRGPVRCVSRRIARRCPKFESWVSCEGLDRDEPVPALGPGARVSVRKLQSILMRAWKPRVR